MATSGKQPAGQGPRRRRASRSDQHIGRDGNQLQNIQHSRITIGSTGRNVLGTIAAVATIIGTIIAIMAFTRPGSGAEPVPQPSFSAASAAATVFTRIVNAGADGVYTYPQPQRGSHYPDGYLDGTVVGVVCQERQGQAVEDHDPAPGQPASWPVWDRLTTGRWIPDMWTSLPKTPGATPPNGLAVC